MPHHFSVDVEEYFHPTPLQPWTPAASWDALPRRAPAVVGQLLDWMAAEGAVGTFFVLGWLARREPEMVRAIAAAGHEIASHGWSHQLVTQMAPPEFREDVRNTKALLEDLTGSPVTGYRAPSFSIVPGCEWALETLIEEGYEYDSSLFPISIHPTYGYPCSRDPHCWRGQSGILVEIPPSTLRVFGSNVPAAGGAYLRFFPYGLIQSAFLSADKRGVPGTFYVHPWELDATSPSIAAPPLLRLRVRGRTGNVPRKVQRLLAHFDFQRMDRTAARIRRTRYESNNSIATVAGHHGPGVSVVVPVLNEEENVGPLVDAVREALAGWRSWELILVDDGSSDGTAPAIREIQQDDPRVRLVRLARNYGQSTAMQAGFDQVRFPVVVTMDGDLQNDPRDIPAIVDELERGSYDLVAGYRVNRKDALFRRKIPSWIANRMIATITGVRIRDNGCSLKAYRRTLIERVRLYSDLHRFIPALAAGAVGARISEVPVRHHARIHGKSKYGLSRVGKVAADLLTIKMIRSFRLNPLRLFGTAATLSMLMSMLAVVTPSTVGASMLVATGVSLLTLALALFLLMLGLVAESVVAVSYRREIHHAPIAREVSIGPSPAV